MEKNKKGSITVEAILVLPIYILVILFIINFLNISYLQLTIQQGLNNAGRTLAQYCYAVDVTLGIERINDTKVDDGIEAVGTVVENFNTLTTSVGNIFSNFSIDNISEIIKEAQVFLNSIKTMKDVIGQIKGENVINYLLTTGTQMGVTTIVESVVDEYLTEMKVNRNLLKDGKINYRVFMCKKDNSENGEYKNDIVLVAEYKYEHSMFSMFTDGINMRQVVAVHPWIGGKTEGVRQK